jgi:predicted secreted hydrolase
MRNRSQKPVKPRIHFPRDEGAHTDYPGEWWYGHFNLTDSGGREYGAMVAYFNFGLRIMMISDLEAEKVYQSVSGSPLHPARGSFELRWNLDRWYRCDPAEYSYSIKSYGPEMELDLVLHSTKPPLLGSGNGLIKWISGNSYYYQFTRLQAGGRIELAGKSVEVEGLGVMDHQWMKDIGPGGWDWFSVQLDNDTEIVFWHIVNPDDSVKHRHLTILSPDATLYHSSGFVLESLDSWVSPHSGREYGMLWRLCDKSRNLDLQISTRYPQQELRMFENIAVSTFPFWEGNTNVSGQMDGEAVSGTGFAEFVRFSELMK